MTKRLFKKKKKKTFRGNINLRKGQAKEALHDVAQFRNFGKNQQNGVIS